MITSYRSAFLVPVIAALIGCGGGSLVGSSPDGGLDAAPPDGPAGADGPSALLPLGGTCTVPGECASGFCECADVGCQHRVCAAAACICGYGPAGGCDAALLPGTEDPGACDGMNACGGVGVCRRKAGQPCTSKDQCLDGVCGCADATCATKICNPIECGCLIATGTGCGGLLTGMGGACKDGSACQANTDCASGQCECETRDCAMRRCVPTLSDCVCKYGGGGACTQDLSPGVKDPSDCDGTMACFGGKCLVANGVDCTAGGDAFCGSGHCECADAGCTTKRCAASDCPCGVVDANGTCTGAVKDGLAGAPGCATAGTACFAGVCRTTCTTTCTGGALCTGGACIDAPCAGAAGTATTPTGQGTQAVPYVICTPQQFAAMATLATSNSTYFVLGTDVNVGTAHLDVAEWKGQFDGRDRSLTVVLSKDGSGTFGQAVGQGAKIHHLKLNVSLAAGVKSFGGVALALGGELEDSTIKLNTMSAPGVLIGCGVACTHAVRGFAGTGAVRRCQVEPIIEGQQAVGVGHVGLIQDTKVTGTLLASTATSYATAVGIGCAGTIERSAFLGRVGATSTAPTSIYTPRASGVCPFGRTTIRETSVRGAIEASSVAHAEASALAGTFILIEDSWSSANLVLSGGGSLVGGMTIYGEQMSGGGPALVRSYFSGNIGVTGNNGATTFIGGLKCTQPGICSGVLADSFTTYTANSGCGAVASCASGPASDFYGSSSPAVASWDFTNVWEPHPGALPTLRRGP